MSRTLDVPAPLAHQEPAMDADGRFKLLRWGRRAGKTRVCFTAAVVGHGPGWREGRPLFKALAQGLDVFWILPEIPQARTIWQEEVRPRFDSVDGARVREHPQFSASLPGMGTLYVISAVPKAIKSVRGAGKKLGGVIIDEAAWLDLTHAWRAVIRPALTDNQGWAIIASTTNSGHDGNHGDDGNGDRLLPSAFNRWCAEVRSGERGAEWMESYATGYDNPVIDRGEMDALAAEYPEGSVRQREEVFAELLAAGAGLAFPEYDGALVDRARTVAEWERWEATGCLDWGYASPGAAYVWDITQSGSVARLGGEVYFNGAWRPDWPEKKTPREVGRIIGERWRAWVGSGVLRTLPRTIVADSACWNETDGPETIADRIEAGLRDALGDDAPILEPCAKGPRSRIARKMLLHEVLRVERDADGRVMDGPALWVASECVHWRRTVPKLPIDPARPEDVDTSSEDHAFDAGTYGLQVAWPSGVKPSLASLEREKERARLDKLSRKEAESMEAPKRRVGGKQLGAG